LHQGHPAEPQQARRHEGEADALEVVEGGDAGAHEDRPQGQEGDLGRGALGPLAQLQEEPVQHHQRDHAPHEPAGGRRRHDLEDQPLGGGALPVRDPDLHRARPR
ncbi:MAG: hypothetical protein ACK559_14385, partial [bacterium]